MENQVLQAEQSDAGIRIDAFVAAQCGISRSRAQKLLETATVGGKIVKASYALRSGDRICLPSLDEIEPAPEAALLAEDVELPPILFEDDDLIVLNKPRGLTVHAGAGETGATLVDILQAHGRTLSGVGAPERPGIVHRLDKDTSGLMLVCKTDAAHWRLAADFEARLVTKTYLALVCGLPPQRGRIEAPVGRHLSQRKKMAVLPGGRSAVTEYEVEKSWEKFALLRINLLTGRTHQIRVHMAYVQHPVVADALYGGYFRAVQNAPHERARQLMEALHGQALHATQIKFEHPMTLEEMEFEAPFPDEVNEIVSSLDEKVYSDILGPNPG